MSPAAPGESTRENAGPSPSSVERITVALIPKAAADLQKLQDRTSLSKTDITNRAISLYEFVDARLRKGHEFFVKDPATGESQQIIIFL